ncbi:amino acid adenylation domain-containing protein, partial [Flavivirga jejuensis]
EQLNETIDHSKTVGWFTTMYPVELSVEDNLDLSIKGIKENLRAIPNKGIGFGAIYPNELINLPAISFNYLGQFDSQDDYWQVVDENSGVTTHDTNIDTTIININGMVTHGQLNFNIATKLGKEETDTFAKNFQRHLEAVILHCNTQLEGRQTKHTPSDFETVTMSQSLLDKIQQERQVESIYLANSLQQGFIYHALSQAEDDAYRVQLLFDYNQALNIDNYMQSWELAIEKYPILRTGFNWEEELIQIVYSTAKLNCKTIDISDLSETERKEHLINLQQEDRSIAFDLTQPCLLRLYIIKQASNHYTILKSAHHSISDGWSGPLLLNNIHNNYIELQQNRAVKVVVDTAYLEAQYFFAKHSDTVEAYWQTKKATIEQTNDLNPLLSYKQALDTVKTLEQPCDTSIEITGEQYLELKNLTKREGLPLNTLIQFAWHKLIQIYTQDTQTIVGTTVSGRAIPVSGIEASVGLFINTLPLIIDWDNNHTVLEQIQYIHQQITDLNSHSFANLASLQEEGKRLFHSLLVFENYPIPAKSENPGEDDLSPEYWYSVEKLDYPLGLTAHEDGRGLVINLQSDKTLLSEDKARYHLEKIKLILNELIVNLDKKHHSLSTLTPLEYNQIVLNWNHTDAAYPKDKSIHELFEEQVAQNPEKIAVVFDDQQLSYAELNAKANQLARYIQTQTAVKTDSLIGLCLDRNLEVIIGILAVLKAGGAYVPIDPEYPAERIQYILEDAKINLVLTQSHSVESLEKITTANLVAIDSECYKNKETNNLSVQNQVTDLAYVIYTSGTTGKPKGVMIDHLSVVNFAVENSYLDYQKVTAVAGLSSFVFDGSIFDLFVPILSGNKYVMFSKTDVTNLDSLADKFIDHGIDTVFFTTALLNSVVEHKMEILSTLTQVLFGGENSNDKHINRIKKDYPDLSLIHVYGPTETVVYATYCMLNELAYSDVSPIGKGLNNKKHYVLDPYLNVCPVGVVGELHIGGAGISRGYLNRPELTAEKFITNPFSTPQDLANGYTRLYKTGDLVRWLPDGHLEFIGRNDFQVKIRGHRIELGEVENALMEISGVKQGCILAKQGSGSKYLVAYFTSELTITEEVIIKTLSAQLPEYMVPSAFVALESFPLNINGKIDRKALPDPEFTDEASYIAPTSDLEIKLCDIWQAVLNLEKIGVSDDFFRIGGDSILSIQLSSRLRKHGLNCSVSAIFDHRTIQQLAQFIASDVDTVQILAEQGNLEGTFDLLPIQQWFFDKVEAKQLPEYNHWNQSFLVKVPELEVEKLQEIIEALAAQHDILRTNFSVTKQRYSSTTSVPQLHRLNVTNLSKEVINETLTNWQSHFDIQKGPLWCVAYLEGYADKTARLYFALHHLIVDAVSWRILIEDFQSLYNNETLGNKSSSYRQWVDEISKYEETHPKEKAYWDSVLKTMPTYDVLEKQAAFSNIEISQKLTGDLLQQANKAYHTEVNDLLLTALGLTLQSWNKKTRNVITLEGHGREQLNETIDHSKTVGWFTTMYPVQLSVQDNLGSSIKEIKESLRAIPNKGIGFGAIYPNELINLPAISFNYLGQFDSQDDYWQVVDENSGIQMHSSNANTSLININGMVTEGRLSFNIVTKLGKDETGAFAKNFQKHLEAVILHCNTQLEGKQTKHTPSDFETVTISESLLDKIQQERQVESIYLANSLQQGFIYHALSQTDDDAYRVQLLFDYNQALNIDHYIQSWELAIEKYPILRTGFNWEEELIQIVYSTAKLNCKTIDVSDLSQAEREERIINLQQEDRAIAFDLTQPCLLRLYIIKQASNHYTVLKSVHHSISDGWSEPVLLSTVHENYFELQQNRPVKVTVDTAYLEVQKYIAKQQHTIEAYWQAKKATMIQINDLNPLLSNNKALDAVKFLVKPYETIIEITGDQYLALKALTKSKGLPLNTLIQFAWHKLIQVYTQDTQTIVGTTVSGRAIPVSGIEESVGLFINTLPLIIDWDNDHTVLEQIQYIHQQITDLNSHSFANLASLQEEGKRLFHSLLVFENYPEPSSVLSEDRLTEVFKYAVQKMDYPMGIVAYEREGALIIKLKSDETLLNKEKAKNNLGKLKLILDKLIVNLNEKHHVLTTLTPVEYEKIIRDWNKTDTSYSNDKTISQLFEEQVLKTPDNIALDYEGKQLSYNELNEKSNQLAQFLRKQYKEKTNQELVADTLVALYLDSSIEMVIGMIAVLKAGGAYVPMSLSFPQERINYILNDTEAKLVLTQRHLISIVEHGNNTGLTDKSQIYLPKEKVLCIDLTEDVYVSETKNNLPKFSGSTDLAYVIYTSGTTGKPKGVMITHRSVSNYNQWIGGHECYANSRIIDCSSSFSFDATLNVLITPLCFGQQVVLCNESIKKDINLYLDHLHFQKVELIKITPSYLSMLLNHSQGNDKLEYLKCLILGGEKANKSELETFIKLNPKIDILHHYGPTETTVGITSFVDFSNKNLLDNVNSLPIGKVAINNRAYVLNTDLDVVPVGVIGELHIAGAALSRGYLNRPELSAEKFITNPFATEDDLVKGYNKLYKTGDLVRWLPDGNIEYIGRNDFQVKIRGFRIELGEIENTLVAIDGITQACVLAKEINKSKYLVAYFTSELTITEEAIIKTLSAQLPEYMVPGAFVSLESFPLTINGKLDRKALPDPEFTDEASYVAPTSDLEIKLCGIWQAVLNLEKIGISDDFFRIGGDSILSIQLSSRLRKHGLNCSVSAIFDHRTIQQLAQFIASEVDTVQVLAEQGHLEGAFDLLPIQKCFFSKVENKEIIEYNHWNHSFLVKVPELEVEKLQGIIEALAAQHDMLRANFSTNRQEYSSTISVPQLHRLNVTNLSKEAINETLTNWQSHFDIQKGPLWCVAYLEGYADQTARLYFALHHLIVDAVSWRILIEDFQSLYNNETLGDKSSSYRQWVDEISKYEETHPKEKAYWDSVLKTMPTYDVLENQEAFSNIEISKKLTGDLLQQANKAYHTEVNDLLLTALGLTLQSWNKKSTNVITLEGHGREQLNETIDHSKTVGWFTTMYPVELSVEDNLESSIKGIKESLRAIPNKGIGFGAIYPNELINLPAISFNYLGQFDSQDDYWQVVDENSGVTTHDANIDTTIININGMVTHGQLNFNIATKLGDQETDVFAKNFQRHLEAVILHCNGQLEGKQTKHTPSDFETVTMSQSLLDKIQKNRQVESIYLANSLQQGFIYHALSQAEDDAYRVQLLFDYKQTLNVDNYIQSWELAIEKYPILRTGFNWEEELIQIVYSTAKLNCKTIDISDLSQTERKERIINLQQEDRAIAFDLTEPCLLRLYIIKQASNHYTILKSAHHSISDGWSGPLLLNNIHNNYIELQQNRAVKVVV